MDDQNRARAEALNDAVSHMRRAAAAILAARAGETFLDAKSLAALYYVHMMLEQLEGTARALVRALETSRF